MTVKLMSPLGPGSSLAATVLTGTYSTQSTISHTPPSGTWAGAGALRTNPTGATGFWGLRGWDATGAQAEMGADTLYASVAFYAASLPAASSNIFQFRNSAAAVLVNVLMTTTGTLRLGYFDGGDSQVNTAPTAALATGRWYTIQFVGRDVSNAGGASIEMLIDGESVASATGLTIRSAARTLDRAYVGTLSPVTADFYFADLVCDDAGWPGNQYIGTLTPDSDVTAQWATGTGATYAEVDEMNGVTAYDSDTSYLGSSTSGNVATVGLKAITPEKRRITAVMPFAIWRDEGGSSVLNLRHISGATTTNLDTLDPGASYVMNAAILSTDPATGAAWTNAAVDAFVVGEVNGANVAARVTALGAYVAFTPGAGGPGQGGVMPLLGAG